MRSAPPNETINPAPPQRSCFIGRANFSDFTGAQTASEEIVLTSPEISVPIAWDELVGSWNVPPGVYLKMEARAIFPDHSTKFYNLGSWSDDPVAPSARERRSADRWRRHYQD